MYFELKSSAIAEKLTKSVGGHYFWDILYN